MLFFASTNGAAMTLPRALRGKILDADSHEMIPAQMWGQVFGPAAAEIAPIFLATPQDGPNSFNIPISADTTEITRQTLREIKNGRAPGAIDPVRRLAVMDFLGIDRQLMFPSGVGITGGFLASRPDPHDLRTALHVDPAAKDWIGLGHELLREHNDWAIRTNIVSRHRLRTVAYLPTLVLEEALTEAKRVVAAGIRAVHMSSCIPPGGKSPA